MKIDDKVIKRIEQAFGIQLYNWQKDYLLGKRDIIEYGRNNGKTFAYCIKLLLSDGEPMKRRELRKYADGYGNRYQECFAGYALEINDKLVKAGFETRVQNL
mgnify:FL=1